VTSVMIQLHGEVGWVFPRSGEAVMQALHLVHGSAPTPLNGRFEPV
jgi:hypothetical protein